MIPDRVAAKYPTTSDWRGISKWNHIRRREPAKSSVVVSCQIATLRSTYTISILDWSTHLRHLPTIILQRQQLHTASLFVIYHLYKFMATSEMGNAGMQDHQWTNGLNPTSCASRRIYTYSTTRSTSTQPSVVVELSHLAKRAVAGPQRRAQFSQAIENQHTALIPAA